MILTTSMGAVVHSADMAVQAVLNDQPLPPLEPRWFTAWSEADKEATRSMYRFGLPLSPALRYPSDVCHMLSLQTNVA